jgi:2-polyprenyl-3-methyl-5-hydroxy-6-metoxy-1,4-benzoquinol methylase
MTKIDAPAYLQSEVDEVVAYLHGLYSGAFTEESIRQHFGNYVGFAYAEYTTAVVTAHLPAGAKLLDIGCGFGSTVIAARNAGIDASGVEIASFEVEFAQRRLARMRPQDDPQAVFKLGDATRLDQADGSLDAVAFWNVLEHIEDCGSMLRAAWRMLKPGGRAYIECPNYAAQRLEAHYHVPWNPELRHDRAKAADYLRSQGRDPTYFLTSIFCRTNAEVLGLLKDIGFEPLDVSNEASMALTARNFFAMLRHPGRFRKFHNPGRESITLVARKPAGRM